MRRLTTLLAVVASSSLGGCAYLSTYTRQVELDKASYSLDVKQRVVFSQDLQKTPEKGDRYSQRVICAEPSPDALTVISASAGASAASEIAAASSRSTRDQQSGTDGRSGQSLSVTAALAEQGAFVGLRTQSIQLLRDTMYRLCEGYAAGAISESEFTAMQRRYQSTMMGLLAIEQLTRPVVAAQVVLASSATGSAGPSASDMAADKAIERLDQKVKEDTQAKVDLSAAQAEERERTRKLEENAAEIRAARQKAERETSGDAQAKKAAADAATKPLEDARVALASAQSEAKERLKASTIRADEASRARREAESDVNVARSRAASSASGAGRLAAVRESSAQMTADLTVGIKEIVQEINKSYMRDGCFAIMSSIVKARQPGRDESGGEKSAMELCTEVIRNQEEYYKQEAQRATTELEFRRHELDRRRFEAELQRQANDRSRPAFDAVRPLSLSAEDVERVLRGFAIRPNSAPSAPASATPAPTQPSNAPAGAAGKPNQGKPSAPVSSPAPSASAPN